MTSGLFVARGLIVVLFAIVFGFGVRGLQTGEIGSKGYLFRRDESPVGYWFTVFVDLVGSVLIIYFILTR